jgi:hypothetical protein
VNHKRVYRIYRKEGLAMRRRKGKRFRAETPVPMVLGDYQELLLSDCSQRAIRMRKFPCHRSTRRFRSLIAGQSKILIPGPNEAGNQFFHRAAAD